jgi:hypothetical protein
VARQQGQAFSSSPASETKTTERANTKANANIKQEQKQRQQQQQTNNNNNNNISHHTVTIDLCQSSSIISKEAPPPYSLRYRLCTNLEKKIQKKIYKK